MLRLCFFFLVWFFSAKNILPTALPPADRPSIHGMLLVGQNRVFASHLPMFHTPHDYQVILELKLDVSSKEIFQESQKRFPLETCYTLEPERFELPEMLRNPLPFKAKIFRGHFERGGEQIASEVTVQIEKIIYLKKLDGRVSQPLDYGGFLFGTAQTQFMAHTLTSAPDFDQITQVKIKDKDLLSRLEGGSVVPLSLVNVPNNRPAEQRRYEAKTLGGLPFKLTILRSLYTEFGDLKTM
jgi:hypothetical protein